jgi:hypothetical protein
VTTVASEQDTKQFGIEFGYDSELEATAAEADLIDRLSSYLRNNGYRSVSAPSLPSTVSNGRIVGNFRIIVQYIPPWLPSRFADQFCVRVDTFATR